MTNIPSIEQLHTVNLDPSGISSSLRRDTAAIRDALTTLDATILHAALTDPKLTLSQTTALLFLIPHLTAPPTDHPALDTALFDLIPDNRAHTFQWGERTHQRQAFSVGLLAAEARVFLLEHTLRQRRPLSFSPFPSKQPPEPHPPVTAILTACLHQALSNLAGPAALRVILQACRQFAWRIPNPADLGQAMADALQDAALNPSRPAFLRLMAARELHKALDTARPPEAVPPLQTALHLVTEVMISRLHDPTADFRLRRHLLPLLTDIAPQRIEQLQQSGAITLTPLPSPDVLMTPWGRANDQALALFAPRVSAPQILLALASPSPHTAAAAIALAPSMIARTDWRLLAQALLALIPDLRTVELSPEPRPNTHPPDLGELAAERLLKVISPPLRRADPQAIDLLHAGLAAIIARDVAPRRGALETAAAFTDAIRWAPDALTQKVTERLQPLQLDPSLPAPARFAAFALALNDTARASAARLTLDPHTDPALRALLGARLLDWHTPPTPPTEKPPTPPLTTNPKHETPNTTAINPKHETPNTTAINPKHETPNTAATNPKHDLAQNDRLTLFQHIPFAEGDPRTHTQRLPISEPGDKVPTTWLLEALSSPIPGWLAFRIIRHLGLRLSLQAHPRRGPLDPLLRDALDTPHIKTHLRTALDFEPTRDAPRWHAAILLALLGDPDDETRLIEFAVTHGPWTRLDPYDEAIEHTRPADHLLLDPLNHPHPHPMLTPYLATGFGPQHTPRLLARIFVRLGQRALHRGAITAARTIYLRATSLDPFNLNARKATQTLSQTQR